MNRAPYGVLLVSFSKHSHQSSFVPLYQAHPRIRIVAVADAEDIDPALKAVDQRWAADLGVPFVEGIDRALALDGVDIVSIGHEIERRADLIIRAAEAGKHLWIDKFAGATLDECEAVVAAVEGAGVKAIVPSYAYSQLVQQSRQVLAGGQLGEFLGLHADMMFGKGWPRPIAAADRKPEFLPPGRWKFPDIKRELLTVGAYPAALIQLVLGPIAHVYAQAGAYFFPEHARHGAEDFGTLTATDSQGRIATLCGGRIGVATHPQGGIARAHLVGTKGTAVIDGKGPDLEVFVRQAIAGANYRPSLEDPMQWHSGPPALKTGLLDDSTGLAGGLEDLLAALDQDRAALYGVGEARDHMQFLLAAYESVVRGEPVSLPQA